MSQISTIEVIIDSVLANDAVAWDDKLAVMDNLFASRKVNLSLSLWIMQREKAKIAIEVRQTSVRNVDIQAICGTDFMDVPWIRGAV